MAGQVNQNVTPVVNEILQGSGKITADGVDLGSYMGGVTITYNQTEVFVDSEWALGPIDGEIQAVDITVSTELEMATLERLAICLGMHSSSVQSATSSKVLTLKPPSVMREVQLVFEGMSGTNRGKIRTFTIYKASKIGSTSVKLNRGVKTTVPVQFKCFLNSAGEFGTIVDSTITA